ncbi:MAG: SDR family NAD(P)-dependent oxidoreductase [Flavobacteriia bacterium]|jgi:benzil reductase ((S)-benzoin forming)
MRVYITGVSGGIGKALAEAFLNEGNLVIGLGRRNNIQHPNFEFIPCDLNNLSMVEQFEFIADQEGCMLINNAGVIGPLKRIMDQQPKEIQEVMTVNVLLPMLLCQKFLQEVPIEKRTAILNISSGAANRAIPSWATYCASKIALDRFSESIYLEELEMSRHLKIYSIAPGAVDTPMQQAIRSARELDFSDVAKFQGMHENRQLLAPNEVAFKIVRFLALPFDGKVVHSINDLVN